MFCANECPDSVHRGPSPLQQREPAPQSSLAKAFAEFDEAGRMKPSACYDRVVDVMEELMKFTRDVALYLVDRYSERQESAEESSRRVNLRSI